MSKHEIGLKARMDRLMFRALALGVVASFFWVEVRADDALQIAVIPKGTTHEFWKSIHAGAVKAQRELEGAGTKVELFWKGPLKEDDREQQIQVVENFITRGVDGMVLAPLDSKALVAPVHSAIEEDIPVVIIDSGLESQKIASFVATDNKKGGRLAGERLGELIGGKGKAILLRYQEGSASTEEREAGFLEIMKEKFPNIELVSTDQHAGATRDTAFRAAQNLLTRFGDQIQGVFTPNESSTGGMVLALRAADKAGGAIKLVGFDASPALVEAMKSGDVQGLAVQNPFQMGYLGVKTLVDVLREKKVEQKVDTGVRMVTPDNMGEEEIQSLLHPPLDEFLKE